MNAIVIMTTLGIFMAGAGGSLLCLGDRYKHAPCLGMALGVVGLIFALGGYSVP